MAQFSPRTRPSTSPNLILPQKKKKSQLKLVSSCFGRAEGRGRYVDIVVAPVCGGSETLGTFSGTRLCPCTRVCVCVCRLEAGWVSCLSRSQMIRLAEAASSRIGPAPSQVTPTPPEDEKGSRGEHRRNIFHKSSFCGRGRKACCISRSVDQCSIWDDPFSA